MLKHSWIAAYFYAQAALIVLWWVLLLTALSSRGLFWPRQTPDFVVAAFLPPDVLVLATASAVGGVLASRRHRWAPAALWVTVGACGYAAFYTLAARLLTGQAGLGAFAMVAAFACTSLAAAAYKP